MVLETMRIALNSFPQGRCQAYRTERRSIRTTGEHAFVQVADPFSYAVLLGLYLGDGIVAKVPRSYQLRLYFDDAYPELIDDAEAMMQLVAVDSRTHRCRDGRGHNMQIVHCGWKRWPEFFPQYGPGRKHERPIVLAPWQQEIVDEHPWELLRGMLHSDGCRTVNRFKTKLPSGRVAEYAHPRWFFSNMSADILGIFTRTCEAVGVRWTKSNHRNISVAHRHSVALLDEHVGLQT